MLDLTSLRKQLPEQFAQMSDEQLEKCVYDMYALAHLAFDLLKGRDRTAEQRETSHEGQTDAR